MEPAVHFISGLPRSGSTLLCAILAQNPAFAANVTSPLASMCDALIRSMSADSEFASSFDDAKRFRLLRNLFWSFYADRAVSVIFDTNRSWTACLPLMQGLFPNMRMICCVRDVAWIIDSFERALRANPAQLSRALGFECGGSIYSRVELLMNSETGLIGLAWSRLREAWYSELARALLVVPYETLLSNPQHTLRRIYEALEQPLFPHDFNRVAFSSDAYDVSLGMPGLHTTQPAIRPPRRDPCIPPDIFDRYRDSNFWGKSQANVRHVEII